MLQAKDSFGELVEKSLMALWLCRLLSPSDDLHIFLRDYALLHARLALFKTDRRKTNSEKAMAIVISATIDYQVGHTRAAQDGFAQATELAGAAFVSRLRLLLLGPLD